MTDIEATKLLDAAKQALEALEGYVDVVVSVNDPNDWITVADGGKPAREAITSLRQAIAEAEKQENKAFNDGVLEGVLRERAFWTKERPEQEPVAFELYHHIVLKLAEAGCKLSEQQKMVLCNLKAVTFPPQRQPLTDEQLTNIITTMCSTDDGTCDTRAMCRAIEAAHGIRSKT